MRQIVEYKTWLNKVPFNLYEVLFLSDELEEFDINLHSASEKYFFLWKRRIFKYAKKIAPLGTLPHIFSYASNEQLLQPRVFEIYEEEFRSVLDDYLNHFTKKVEKIRTLEWIHKKVNCGKTTVKKKLNLMCCKMKLKRIKIHIRGGKIFI
jgi:hypothetical protein